MGTERFAGESAINYEMKCMCVLVLDVSGSMKGDKLNALNQGVRDFFTQIQTSDGVAETTKDQLEVSIIQYDEEVKILRDPKLIEDKEIPPTLTERGSVTDTVGAIREAIKLVEDRKAFYNTTGQRYYRPWIILMTDGEPYMGKEADSQLRTDIEIISEQVVAETKNKKYMMIGVGIGAKANMALLEKMAGGKALRMGEKKFGEFFQWLSASLSLITTSKDGDKINIREGSDKWLDSYEI
ncbi:vWA domain-containing protein [Parabacteroides sp.]